MREILFKAKSENIDGTFDWVEGYLSKCDGKWTICDDEGIGCFVEEETICQYTGLTDKNGNKIWENDICDRKEPFPEIVKMQKGDWILDYSYAVGRENCYCNLGFYVCERKSVEVIGNIFDNAELLEVLCTNSRTGN